MSLSLVAWTSAVAVDYYPQPDHHSNHVKYVQPAHISPVKYVHQQPQHVKYVQEPHHVKYVQEPHHVKYVQEPQHVKYVHQPQHVKYVEKPHYEKHIEYDEPAQYEYGYTVHDDHTGDYKSHTEKRDGDTVHGRYEIVDPDGFKRIVEYTADAHNGFNAVVTREPTDIKIPQPVPVVQKVVQKVIAAEPVKYYTKPKYYAPEQKYIVSEPAPVVKQIISPTPQYYAAPEHPKYFKASKIVKPVYAVTPEPHTAIKYVQPAAHYSKDYHYWSVRTDEFVFERPNENELDVEKCVVFPRISNLSS